LEVWNEEDDDGNWHYAYCSNMAEGSELVRVSGDESGVGNGGPSGPPPLAPDTTYYLRMTRVGNSLNDSQIYLQENLGSEYSELWGGMWFYLEDNISFLGSIKLFDFRDGDRHGALFGTWSSAKYCSNNSYGPCDYSNTGSDCYGDWPASHNLLLFKYRKAAGENGCEEMLNYWESYQFEQNLDSEGDPIPSRTYDTDDVARVKLEGGKWMALIVYSKFHATDGIQKAWLYDGVSLKKVMEWDNSTVWNADGASDGHDFYTLSEAGTGMDQLQVNAYWNNWTSFTGTKYAWVSNVCTAENYEAVVSYLGL